MACPDGNEADIRGAREHYAAIHPRSGSAGGCVDVMSGGDAHRFAENYDADHERPSAGEGVHDSRNRFHFNQNIEPSNGW